MLSEIFSATNHDLSVWVPKGTWCYSIGLTFKLGNLAKFQKFENLQFFFKLILQKLRKF